LINTIRPDTTLSVHRYVSLAAHVGDLDGDTAAMRWSQAQ